MPELPEVETVRRGLSETLLKMPEFMGVVRSPYKLRFRFPAQLSKKLAGQRLQSIERRAKYLLFYFETHVLINHLGMTGSWRTSESIRLNDHDHVVLRFQNDQNLIYRDPRRFGYFDLIGKEKVFESRWFRELGPEPLDSSLFTSEYLFRQSRRRKGPLKTFIMNQKIVVGVGNIYASESLFQAGLSPVRSSGGLSLKDCERLVHSIQSVLQRAIGEGGTTIRDYVNVGGETGAFAQSLKVYGREGEKCVTCGSPIRQIRLAGRSTYGCLKCQR